MNIKYLLSRLDNIGAAFNAMISVKRGRPMVNTLVITVRAIGKGIQSSYVRIIISFVSSCSRLARRSGIKFLVLTLKANYITMLQAIARSPIKDQTDLKVRFKRGRGGLPSIIPVLHRIRIINGDRFVIRLWSTLFSVYRVLEFAGTIKISTITDPSYLDPLFLYEWSKFVRESFIVNLCKRFATEWLGEIREDPTNAWKQLVLRPFIISKTSSAVGSHLSTSVVGIIAAFRAWSRSPDLLPIIRDWLQFTGNIRFLNWFNTGLKFIGSRDDAGFFNFNQVQARAQMGRIGLKDEPAGKVRMFALVDAFTQWALAPLHDKIFEILRLIPQDGTFDQLKPLDYIQNLGLKGVEVYSFDLSAATDRLPVTLQACIVSSLLGSHGANMWMSLLVARFYTLPHRMCEELGLEPGSSVLYAVGQPIGARTSWAMLALCHHAIVQYAAQRAGVVGPTDWFEAYGVLGDDIVIADGRVADAYLAIIREINVGVNPSKSLVAESGTLIYEFAKRVFGATGNWSPVPILEAVAARLALPAWIEFVRKYNMSLSQGLIVLGYGYRAVSQTNKRLTALPRRLQSCLLSWAGPGGVGFKSFSDFFQMVSLDTKVPLDPISIGSLIQGIRDSMLQRLEDLRPRMKAILDLITVDRTRVHYGIDAPREGFIPTFDISGPLTDVESVWIRTLIEYCYRDYYLDVGDRYRKLISDVELITTTASPELLNSVFESIQNFEEDIGAIQVQAKEIRAEPTSPSKALWKMYRPSSWARRWRDQNSCIARQGYPKGVITKSTLQAESVVTGAKAQ